MHSEYGKGNIVQTVKDLKEYLRLLNRDTVGSIEYNKHTQS